MGVSFTAQSIPNLGINQSRTTAIIGVASLCCSVRKEALGAGKGFSNSAIHRKCPIGIADLPDPQIAVDESARIVLGRMKAEIKSYFLSDFRGNELRVEDPDFVGAHLGLVIGPPGVAGGDNFSVIVCTPSWFAANILTTLPAHPSHEVHRVTKFGRHHLFMACFDEGEIHRAIQDLLERTTGADWSAVAARLSRDLHWEFEDYRETPPIGD